MRQEILKKTSLIILSLFALSSMVGCAKERVVTYDVTKTGKNWSESESVQESRGPGGKRVIEKQYIREKLKCVNKRGHRIKASTADECIKKGGRIVDETWIEEETIERK